MESKLEQLPTGHGNYSEADKEKCPYFQMQKKHEKAVEPSEVLEKEEKEPNTKKKKKEKKPQGGCPFFPERKLKKLA